MSQYKYAKVKIINPFTDIPPFVREDAPPRMENLTSISVGVGDRAFRVDKNGMWLGSKKWVDAIFRVDMDGNGYMAGVFSFALNDLDDVVDGTSYKRVLSTDISAGHILLSETVGSLDDVDNGATYARVLTNDITAGHIKLDETVAGTYGKVLTTAITAGNIKLDATVDGTYGKVLSTAISAGKILLTTGVSGTLSTSYTQAKATLGLNAYNDVVDAVNSGTTTITGSRITAGSIYVDQIAANTITAGKLNISTLSAISADIGTVTAGTISGTIVKTAASGTYVIMSGDDAARIRWYYSGSQIAFLKAASASTFQIIGEAGIGIEYMAETHKFYHHDGAGAWVFANEFEAGANFILPSGGDLKTGTGNFDLNPQGGIIYTKRLNCVSCGGYNIGGTGDRYSTIYSTTALNSAACDVADVLIVAPEFELEEAAIKILADERIGDTELKAFDIIEKIKYRKGLKDLPKKERDGILESVIQQDNEKRVELVTLKRFSKIKIGSVVRMSGRGVVPSDKENDTRIAGILSTQPALELGGSKEGVYVALSGVVPCYVLGQGSAGDRLVSTADGCAVAVDDNYPVKEGALLGKLINDKANASKELVEVWAK